MVYWLRNTFLALKWGEIYKQEENSIAGYCMIQDNTYSKNDFNYKPNGIKKLMKTVYVVNLRRERIRNWTGQFDVT